MTSVVVLFTRDLRVHDHPALSWACEHAERVTPLFVLDEALSVPDNRRRFLQESLLDLRKALRKRGGDLLVRVGDPVTETLRLVSEVGATAVAVTQDYSAYARRRETRLAQAAREQRFELRLFPGVTIVPPGVVAPTTGGRMYKVFTPYWRAWEAKRWRSLCQDPQQLRLADGVSALDPRTVLGEAPAESPGQVHGGETEALKRLDAWSGDAPSYVENHDALHADKTSRLSPYLHFGCLSPLALATTPGLPEAFRRQLCWRDFYHQILAEFPKLGSRAFRPGAVEQWSEDADALERWRTGNTGVPIVDAGMRQLLEQGWMHNRARMITASYLTKTLELDWREGAAWFDRWLIDADVANNYGNWQWIAGTGTDTKPYRRFSPQRQTERFDPEGLYIKQWTGSHPKADPARIIRREQTLF